LSHCSESVIGCTTIYTSETSTYTGRVFMWIRSTSICSLPMFPCTSYRGRPCLVMMSCLIFTFSSFTLPVRKLIDSWPGISMKSLATLPSIYCMRYSTINLIIFQS
jgi:hypothetical protein